MASNKPKSARPISRPVRDTPMRLAEADAARSVRWDAAAYLYAHSKGGRELLRHWFRQNYMRKVASEDIGGESWEDWFMRACTPVYNGYILQFDAIWWRTEATVGKLSTNLDEDCIWLENFLDDYINDFSLETTDDYALEFIRARSDFKAARRAGNEDGKLEPDVSLATPFVYKAGFEVRNFLRLREVPTIIINDVQIPDTAGVIYRRGSTEWDDTKKRQRILGGEVMGAPVRSRSLWRDPFSNDEEKEG